MNYSHNPVMLEKVIKGLNISSDGIYVDCTFGRGGHSKKILSEIGENGKLIAIDKDCEAEKYAREHFGKDKRFCFVRNNFSKIIEIIENYNNNKKIDGILLDLGVSSPQLDDPERGFSFQKSGPIDMRMDKSDKLTALSWLKVADQNEIKEVLKIYGEEKYAHRIAKSIKDSINKNSLSTTIELAEIIEKCYPKNKKSGRNPATKSFQAIRIYINNELQELESFLNSCLDIIASGGRIVVISFHSLEDRMVKRFIKKHSEDKNVPSKIPLTETSKNLSLRKIKTTLKANDDEVALNKRARSARIRIAEKI